jgi:hypothetical protein
MDNLYGLMDGKLCNFSEEAQLELWELSFMIWASPNPESATSTLYGLYQTLHRLVGLIWSWDPLASCACVGRLCRTTQFILAGSLITGSAKARNILEGDILGYMAWTSSATKSSRLFS